MEYLQKQRTDVSGMESECRNDESISGIQNLPVARTGMGVQRELQLVRIARCFHSVWKKLSGICIDRWVRLLEPESKHSPCWVAMYRPESQSRSPTISRQSKFRSCTFALGDSLEARYRLQIRYYLTCPVRLIPSMGAHGSTVSCGCRLKNWPSSVPEPVSSRFISASQQAQ